MSASLATPRPVASPPAARTEGGGLATTALLLCVLLSLAVQACTLAAPLLTMHIFNAALEDHNMATLVVVAMAYGVSLLLGSVLGWLRASLLAALSARVGRSMQVRALQAAVRFALGGDRVRGLTTLRDVAELRRLLSGTIAADLLDLMTVPAVLIFLWLLHPAYALVAFICFLLKVVLGSAAHRATHGLLEEGMVAQTRAIADLSAQLRQRDTLLGLGMLPAVLRRWAPLHALALERQDAAQRRIAAIHSLTMLLGFAQLMAMVTTGGLLIVQNLASPGSLLAASLLASLVSYSVGHLVANLQDWTVGLTAWRRLRRLGSVIGPAVMAAPAAGAPAEAGLVLRGLTCCRPGEDGRALVRDLTLQLRPGEALLVRGPNGIGKTTLLRTLIGLVPAEAGAAALDGADLQRTARAVLGPRIGYLPQEAQLLEGSIAANIARFAGDLAGAVAAARTAGAHAMIGHLPQGYDSPAGAASGLSGGQQRLVALARALYGQPGLLVLDEPEASLDAAGLAALRGAVLAAKAWGAAVVIVSHQPDAWDGQVEQVLHLGCDGAWHVDTPLGEHTAPEAARGEAHITCNSGRDSA